MDAAMWAWLTVCACAHAQALALVLNKCMAMYRYWLAYRGSNYTVSTLMVDEASYQE